MRSWWGLVWLYVISVMLHLYVGSHIVPDLPVRGEWKVAAYAILIGSAILVPAGLVARFLMRRPWADAFAWAGLIAMGWFSTLLVLTFSRDLLFLLAGWMNWTPQSLIPVSAAAVPLLATLITALGFINARRLAKVNHVYVPLQNLPNSLRDFTIVQISDIHVGPTIKGRYLANIVQAVNALKPDIVAVTGDVVDGSVRELGPHVAHLSDLSAKYGTFLVTGNHEYYSNGPAWIQEFARLGMRVLLNEHEIIQQNSASVMIAGVTDYSAHHFETSHRSDPQAAMANASRPVDVKVLLAHQPRSAFEAERAGFDLQLSGHTHGGQFFPWNFFVRLQQPFTAGLHKLQNLWVYTSRGTGYWGPPKRFWAPSEITCLHLVGVTDAGI